MLEGFMEVLLGPMGGVAGLGFGAGFAAGYTFALSRVAKARLEAAVEPLKIKITHLAAEVEELKEELRKERELRLTLMEKLINVDSLGE